LAFGEIVGKRVGAVHVTGYCSESSEQEKGLSSTGAAIPSPPTSRPQVQAAQQPVQLAIVQFDALLIIANAWELKSAGFQPFVPNAKSILIPEQDFDAIAITIEEQEQVARQRVLIEDLLSLAHQAIEAITHLRRRHAEEDPDIGKVCHEFGDFQGRSVPTTRIASINAAWPIPKGSRTTPPFGNWSSTGDAFRETGKNIAGAISACSRAAFSATKDSGMPSRSWLVQR
jgi:hypothetical protein